MTRPIGFWLVKPVSKEKLLTAISEARTQAALSKLYQNLKA